MKLVIDPKTNEKSWVYDVVMIDGVKEFPIVRSFTRAQTTAEGRFSGMDVLYETPEGSFTYASGNPVTNKSDLDWIDPAHRDRAYAWFDEVNKPEESDPEIPVEPKRRGRPPKGTSREDLLLKIDLLEKRLNELEGGSHNPAEGA